MSEIQTPQASPHRRHFLRRSRGLWVAVSVVGLGALGALGVASVAKAQGIRRAWAFAGAMGHGHAGGPLADPEAAKARADFAIDFVLRAVDGTEDQRARAQQIARDLIGELSPMAQQHKADHQAMVAALSGSTVDRGTLERLRKSEIALADQASRRILTAVADFAETLTPEQRTELKQLGERFHALHRPQH